MPTRISWPGAVFIDSRINAILSPTSNSVLKHLREHVERLKLPSRIVDWLTLCEWWWRLGIIRDAGR